MSITVLAVTLNALRRPARGGQADAPAATCEGWEALVKLTVNDAGGGIDGLHLKSPLPPGRPKSCDRPDRIGGWPWTALPSPSWWPASQRR